MTPQPVFPLAGAILGGMAAGTTAYPAWRLGPRVLRGVRDHLGAAPLAGLAMARRLPALVGAGALLEVCGCAVLVGAILFMALAGQAPAFVRLLACSGLLVLTGIAWRRAISRLMASWRSLVLEQALPDLARLPEYESGVFALDAWRPWGLGSIGRQLELSVGIEILLLGERTPFRASWLYAYLRRLSLGGRRAGEPPTMGLARAYWDGCLKAFTTRYRAWALGGPLGIEAPRGMDGPSEAYFWDGVASVTRSWGNDLKSLPRGGRRMGSNKRLEDP